MVIKLIMHDVKILIVNKKIKVTVMWKDAFS